jgi:Ca2+-binding EF-hand superfamily protein
MTSNNSSHNASAKDSERYHELFKKLDVNSDGKIDVNDLVHLFKKNNSNETSIHRAKVTTKQLNFKRCEIQSICFKRFSRN